ncbi:MAG: ATP-NAD kinase [Candidatus Lokiarchaeota archaeon]|nr:ATP-NAD kinase [Candidatus Lokiarchaeota archaeon]MBD3338472.1 ATP-NAD kinase [Candidatus Lokiarchaeota archaeon]
MRKFGLIVNPIAGMGGSVGLKGTDGLVEKAIELGAEPITPHRMKELIRNIKSKEEIFFLVAPKNMGEQIVKDSDFQFKVVGEVSKKTSAEDTKRIAKLMIEKGIELLIFCGGDGTARDIYDAIDLKIPVIAIPSGVKMFSSLFALNPRAAAKMIQSFVDHSETVEKEVLDIDEDAFREGKLDAKLYGYLRVPKVQNLIQGGKQTSKVSKSATENKEEIAQQIVENMEDDVIYFLGPGTTVKAITDRLELPKTLLGIDALFDKRIVGEDVNEEGILKLLKKHPKAKIVVSPIGGQGFIFGRGNKQFTAEVIRKIGKENIVVVSTEDKVKGLPCLRVDTGELEVDNDLKGYIKVLVGYHEELVMEIEC